MSQNIVIEIRMGINNQESFNILWKSYLQIVVARTMEDKQMSMQS